MESDARDSQLAALIDSNTSLLQQVSELKQKPQE